MNAEVKEEKNPKIKKMIIGISLFLIFIIVSSIIYFINLQIEKYDTEEISEFIYFTLYKNQKYGVIDKSGNVIIEANYDMVIIPNPSKPVFICYEGYNLPNEEYKTKVFNENKEQIFKDYEQILPIIYKDSSTKVPYEKGILKYKKDDKYGLITLEERKVTKAEYNSIESLLYKEGYLIVEKEGKYGVINAKGKNIVDIKYDSVGADGYYNENEKYKKAGFIVGIKTQTGYQYGYINYKGKIVLEPEYNEINRVIEVKNDDIYLLVFKNGQAGIYKENEIIINHLYDDIEYNIKNELFIVEKVSKQGVINKQGKIILKPEYEDIYISNNKITATKDEKDYIFDMEGNIQEDEKEDAIISTENENYFIRIDENNNYSVVNKENEEIIPNKYYYIEYIFEDYFIVVDNMKTGVINIKNEEKVEKKYDVIQRIDNSNVIQANIVEDKVLDLYNENMEKIASVIDGTLYKKEEYIKVTSENEIQYFDLKGNKIDNKKILNNELYAYKENNKWGFTDINNNIKVMPEYDKVTEFNEYGFAGIKKDDKWGVIDKTGEIILNPIYKLDWQEPEFIGKYYKINFDYGLDYYTDDIIEE